MSRLTQYHVNLLNHFKPADVNDGFWYDYISRLSRKDARIMFRKQQHLCLQVVKKTVRPSIARIIKEQVKERQQIRRRKDRPRYKVSPQSTTKDRRTTIPFNLKA